MCIVRPDGPPQLCKTDEIGEIVINSRAGGNMYYGLPGLTKNTFEVGGQDYNLRVTCSDTGSENENVHHRPLCLWVISR